MEVCKGLGGVVDLTENLTRAFNDPELFEQDEETGDYYTWSSELEFPIEEELITGDGDATGTRSIMYRSTEISIFMQESVTVLVG